MSNLVAFLEREANIEEQALAIASTTDLETAPPAPRCDVCGRHICRCPAELEASKPHPARPVETPDLDNDQDVAVEDLPTITDGTQLHAADGVVYVVENMRRRPVLQVGAKDVLVRESLTLRRLTPKVKGKAAKKADKRARRRGRRPIARLVDKFVDIDWNVGQ
jgi:hypothetical protein